MYAYNEGNLPNNDNAQQPPVMFQPTVPNVMFDETQNFHDVHIQQGAVPINNSYVGEDMGQTTNGTMPLYGLEPPPVKFDIPDVMERRALVLRLFVILLLQNILMLPVMELFLLCSDGPVTESLYGSVWVLSLVTFTAMYFVSELRRYAPMNILALILITILMCAESGIYATQIGSRMAFLSQIVIIVQIIGIIIYATQQRFRFTNLNAILLVVLVFVAYMVIVSIVAPNFVNKTTLSSVLNVVYYVYDTQLMMCGHHGYNMQPGEHIYAATNIYADIPNFVWRFFRYIFLDHFIRIYKFFITCCSADVC